MLHHLPQFTSEIVRDRQRAATTATHMAVSSRRRWRSRRRRIARAVFGATAAHCQEVAL